MRVSDETSPGRDDARPDDGPRTYEPARLGSSPLHRMPTVSVIAFAVIVVIVASVTRGPVRWLMLAVVVVAALSAWRSARIRARRAREQQGRPGDTRAPGPDVDRA